MTRKKFVRAPWVPGRLSEAERAADIAAIKALAESLSYEQAGYAATLESIVLRARKLFNEEAPMVGRAGTGPNKICASCDGVYVKEKRCHDDGCQSEKPIHEDGPCDCSLSENTKGA